MSMNPFRNKVRYIAITHDVAPRSNLDLILRGSNGAINKLADAIGGGLKAIALALSTPQDNSGEVQKELDKLTTQLKSSTDALDATVRANQPEGEE